jgi:RND superfamily putative drug exporter
MPASTPKNLAARAGRWSAEHRRAAIGGWIAFVLVALVVGGALGTKTLNVYEKGFGESGRADKVLHESGIGDAVTESVLITAPTRQTVRDPATKAAIADVTARLKRSDAVRDVRPAQISRDWRAALIPLQLKGSLDDAGKTVEPVIAAVNAVEKAHPEVSIQQTGEGSIAKAYDDTMEEDFRQAELFSVPLTFLILFFAFGAVVAAGIPVLLGLSAVAAALGLIAIPSQAIAVEESASSVILLIGLAVGVDYALFYLRREREERAAGRSSEAALNAAAATSGRAVLVSGFTVIASVAGMFVAGSAWYTSYAIGIITVVGVAMAGSVTVLPAVLSWLGDRVEKGRPRFMKRREHRAGHAGRLWTAVLDRVVRRPIAALVLAGAVMLALAAPTLDLHLNDPGMGSLPQGEPAVVAFEDAQARFPGDSRPALVAVQASDVRAPEIQAAIERLEPTAVDINRDGTVARLTVPLPGDGVDDRSFAALDRLRDTTLPATLGGIEGVRASVTGLTAYAADQKSVTESRAPLVFALVLGMGFLVLLVTFRSIVIPIKAIALNLLSVAASYGVLVLVFQKGWGESLLGFESTGAIAIWLPILLFVILFGLSMDYHVLVLSRIREAYEDGMSMDDAVAHGIKSTASVVTSAALVMVAVFSIFATLGILEMKQLGVGLAVAVLLDATIVRAVLLPASMKLLGEWNWYLPRGLRWLPRVGGEPRTIDPEPATA